MISGSQRGNEMKLHKKVIATICIIVIAVTLISMFKEEIGSSVIQLISYEFERERSKEVDEYNILSWNDSKFQINHYSSGNQLDMIENEKTIVLLENIIKYKKITSKLYIITPDDQAIIDKNNIAYIHIGSYDPNNDKDVEIESNGKVLIYSKRYKSNNIIYLESINNFETSDKEILEKLINDASQGS